MLLELNDLHSKLSLYLYMRSGYQKEINLCVC